MKLTIYLPPSTAAVKNGGAIRVLHPPTSSRRGACLSPGITLPCTTVSHPVSLRSRVPSRLAYVSEVASSDGGCTTLFIIIVFPIRAAGAHGSVIG
jgi:hypothetical protein